MTIVTPRLLRLFPSDALMRLSVAAGWNQTEEDWRRLVLFAPDYCWGIEVDGMLAASITAHLHSDGWAWIGMVLTLPEYRGRGLASTLLNFLLEQLDQAGVESIGLDATVMGQPIYEKLGFVATEGVERWARTGTLLAPGRGVRLTTEDGQLYLRPGREANQLGPFFAKGEEAGRELLQQVPTEFSMYWDLFPANEVAVRLAGEQGLQRARQLTRMWRGPIRQAAPAHQLALSGFEYGC